MKISPKKKAVLEIYGHEPVDMDDLGKCCIAVLNSQSADCFKETKRKVKVVGLQWEVEHSMSVSNTHVCPLDGVTNWGGDKDNAPRGYPGWQGRVWVRYAERVESFGNGPWDKTITHPGTGGWGGYSGPWEEIYSLWFKKYGYAKSRKKIKDMYPEPQVYSWDFKIFDQDWPHLAKESFWTILKDVNQRAKHRFMFYDHDTRVADEAFKRSVYEI
jgi:hypothetical protein